MPRLLLLAAFALNILPGQERPRFSLGESREAVRRAQGNPAVIERLPSLGVELWSYGRARVRFSLPAGAVSGWDDPARELRVDLKAGRSTGASEVALGAPAADAIKLFGLPSAVRTQGTREAWWFGAVPIVVDARTRTVAGWRSESGNIRFRAADTPAAALAYGETSPGASNRTSRPPGSPPVLNVAAVLADSSPRAMTAGSRNLIRVTIANRGTGVAYSVQPTVHVEPAEASRLVELAPVTAVSSLSPGESATREIMVRFALTTPDTVVDLVVGATEANGFDVDHRVVLRVPIHASLLPRFVVDHVRVQDQSGDGRLAPRELADVTVTVRNAGRGAADHVFAELSLGRDVFVAAGTPPRFQLGTLPPAAAVDITFSLYTNTRAESTVVALRVRPADGRGEIRLPVPLPLEHAARRGDVMTAVRPSSGAAGIAAPQYLDDIDGEIPREAWAPPNPNALAVVFGIDRYRSLPPARFAARDAIAMARHAVALFGVPDDPDHRYLRIDADATGSEFRKVFGESGWLARRATPQSEIVVFFAGHGVAGPNGEPLLLPWDADANYPRETAIPLADVYAALAKVPARTITIVLDACFSGLTRNGSALTEGTRPIVVSVEHPALVRSGMAVFAAAQGAQFAGDLQAEQHGLFSYQFLRGVRGAADRDTDRQVTVAELDAHLVHEVPRAALRGDREQRPLTVAGDASRTVVRLHSASGAPAPATQQAVPTSVPPVVTSPGYRSLGVAVADTVTIEQRTLLVPEATQGEVRKRAIEGALAEAVRRVAGVRVQSQTLAIREERGGHLRDDFASVVQLDAAARVVDYTIIEDEWVTARHPELGSQVYYRVVVRALVQREVGVTDAAFDVQLRVAPEILRAPSARAERNEELLAHVRSSRDGELVLVSIGGDSAHVLVPNAYVPRLRLRAGEEVQVPAEEWRARGLRLRPVLPAGLDRRRELVVAVVLRSAAPPFNGGTVLDFQRWLVGIPLEQRAMGSAVVEVRRGGGGGS